MVPPALVSAKETTVAVAGQTLRLFRVSSSWGRPCYTPHAPTCTPGEHLPLFSILIGHWTVALELSTLGEPALQLVQGQPFGDHVRRWEGMRR